MRKVLISLIVMLLSAPFVMAQYATAEAGDVAMSQSFKTAKAIYNGGMITACVGTAVWLGGNVVCVVEQNKYTNSHSKTGDIDEILALNEEAKQQPGYRTGEILEKAGFAAALVGAGAAWYGYSRMKKIRNSSGQTVATVNYGLGGNGLAFTMNF